MIRHLVAASLVISLSAASSAHAAPKRKPKAPAAPSTSKQAAPTTQNAPAAPAAPTTPPVPPTPAAPPAAAAPTEEPGEYRGYFGVMGGAGFYFGSPSAVLGMTAGYKVTPSWGLGFQFNYKVVDSVLASNGVLTTAVGGASLMLFAVEINYFGSGPFNNFYAGVRSGMVRASAAAAGPVSNQGAFAGGIGAGYDYPVMQHFSAGLQANFIGIASSGGTSSLADALATIKFRF